MTGRHTVVEQCRDVGRVDLERMPVALLGACGIVLMQLVYEAEIVKRADVVRVRPQHTQIVLPCLNTSRDKSLAMRTQYQRRMQRKQKRQRNERGNRSDRGMKDETLKSHRPP